MKSLLLPADARLQAKVGGVRQALNARLAAEVLKKYDPKTGFAPVRARFKRQLAQSKDLIPFNRKPMNDSQIVSFVRQELRRDSTTSRTRLLRKLRDGGMACEQSRFGRIFEQTKESINGPAH
jgi:hypothetical protein